MTHPDPSTTAPGRPQREGEYVVFRSPHTQAPDVLLVDVARRDAGGRLVWAAAEATEPANHIRAAIAGYRAIPDESPDDPVERHVRTNVLRQYAANLLVREEKALGLAAQGKLRTAAADIARLLLIDHGGQKTIPFAINLKLEDDVPRLADIEHALAIGERLAPGLGATLQTTLPSSTLEALKALREGTPSMFSVDEQLEGLILTHPELGPLQEAQADLLLDYTPQYGCM